MIVIESLLVVYTVQFKINSLHFLIRQAYFFFSCFYIFGHYYVALREAFFVPLFVIWPLFVRFFPDYKL